MRKFVDFISKICDMLDIERFIAKNVTGREESFFVHDLEAHSAQIRSEIAGKKVCVGATQAPDSRSPRGRPEDCFRGGTCIDH